MLVVLLTWGFLHCCQNLIKRYLFEQGVAPLYAEHTKIWDFTRRRQVQPALPLNLRDYGGRAVPAN